MIEVRKSLLRPEEILFLVLLGLILVIHLILREPYFFSAWLGELWYLNPAFRIGVIAGGLCLGTGLAILRGLGPSGHLAIRRLAGAARDFLPFGYMVIVYEGLQSVAGAIHGRVLDDLLLRVDELLFGHQAFMTLPGVVLRLPHAHAAVFYLAFCYSGVFVAYWGLAIYFYFCFSRRVFRQYMLAIVLTSFLGYLCYLFVPAIGPYEAFIRPGLMELQGWLGGDGPRLIARFADHIRGFHIDKVPACDAFPSLHTAWAIVVVGFSARYAPWLLWLVGPWAVGMVLGALFFQQHYLVDIVAAIPLAAVGTAAATALAFDDEDQRDRVLTAASEATASSARAQG